MIIIYMTNNLFRFKNLKQIDKKLIKEIVKIKVN